MVGVGMRMVSVWKSIDLTLETIVSAGKTIVSAGKTIVSARKTIVSARKTFDSLAETIVFFGYPGILLNP